MIKENGGPAFPVLDWITPDKQAYNSQGMTLRDYFAAKASDGDIGEIMSRHFDHETDEYTITRQQARYMHADTMLVERNK